MPTARNRFTDDKLISQSKIAALMVESIHEYAEGDAARIFDIPEAVRALENYGDIQHGLILRMAWNCLSDVLRLRHAEIDNDSRDPKNPANLKQDFFLCMYRYETDTEWLALTCALFLKAYGVPFEIVA